MNNSNEIKLINENGKEVSYGQIPDLWHHADFIGKHFGEQARENVIQVWMMAQDLKSVIEEQDKAQLTEVLGLNQNQRGQLDAICQEHTAFGSFFKLVNSHADYRPTTDVSETAMRILADAYDKFQEARGDDRRAFRTGTKS